MSVNKSIKFIVPICLFLFSCGTPADRKIPTPNAIYKVPVSGEIQGRLKYFIRIPKQEMLIHVEIDSSSNSKDYILKTELNINFFKPSKIAAGSGYNNFGPDLELVLLDKDKQRIKNIRCSKSLEELATLIRQAPGNVKIPFSSSAALFLDFTGDGYKKDLTEAFTFLYDLEMAKEGILASEIILEKVETSSSSGKSTTNNGSDSCEEFLTGYKKFVTDYIKILKEQQSNPSDLTLMNKAANLATEANSWAANSSSCQSDPAFASKYAKIQLELSTALIN